MTNKDLFFAIGDIEENWLNEAENCVNKALRKKNTVKTVIPFAACFVVLFAAAFIWTVVKTDTPALSKGDSEETSGKNTSPSSTATTDMPSQNNSSGLDGTNGNYSYFNIPALPKDREIITVGEKITDSEAQKYFAKNRESILNGFSESGVGTNNIRISEKGYCHVSYTGKDSEKLTVKENFRDYLVYNGEKLVAIITLVKENGKISSTPMFGAAWFSGYGKFLSSHKGEELVFVYSGATELVITPDNTVYAPLLSPKGYDASIYFKGTENPYEMFYHSADIYTP